MSPQKPTQFSHHTTSSFDNYISIGDVIIFGGVNDTIGFSRYEPFTDIVATGTNQTVTVAEIGNAVVFDFARHLDIVFDIDVGLLTVYGAQHDPGVHVTLLPFQTATQKTDGHGGTFLTIAGAGSGPGGAIAHFVHDPHVTVVTS